MPTKRTNPAVTEIRRELAGDATAKLPVDKPVDAGDKTPRKRVPQRDGMAKRLRGRIARGGAL